MSAPTLAEADTAYLAHHFQCRPCISAGQFRGERCPTGQPLWQQYLDALPPEPPPRKPAHQRAFSHPHQPPEST